MPIYVLRKPYILINLIFAGIIACIMLYSGIFSAQKNNHPIVCSHMALTGKPCPTCGISRSFSEMVRGRFESARNYNPYGPKIFLFFLVQLFLRLGISLLISRKPSAEKYTWPADAIISILLLLYCFGDLILP